MTFRNVPVAIDIDPDYSDQLWVKDSRFENVSSAAIVISNETERDHPGRLRERASAPACRCSRGSARAGRPQRPPAPIYRVASFNHGLVVPGDDSIGRIDTRYDAAPLDALPAPLPPAIRRAAADRRLGERAHARRQGRRQDRRHRRDPAAPSTRIRVLYFPSGHYIVRDTIR